MGHSIQPEANAAVSVKVTSPAPLHNETKIFYQLCAFSLIPLLLGFLFSYILMGLSIAFMLIFFTIGVYSTRHKERKLRNMAFAFRNDISADTLFETIQPILISKYGLDVEKNQDVITVVHKNLLFDIHIDPNGTFRIWWRKSVLHALFSFNDYKEYKRILAGMGFIAYEIQKAFAI